MASAQHELGTVIRIKRKRSADPFNALLVHCGAKKSKVDDTSKDDVKDDANSLFQFAGTITEDEVKSTTKLLENFKRGNLLHEPNISKLKQRSRKNKKENQQLARYRVVSQLREEKNDSGDGVEKQTTENTVKKYDDQIYNVYDVVADGVEEEPFPKKIDDVDKLMCNSVEMIREKLCIDDSKKAEEAEYVYDLYYAPNTILNAENEILRIEEFYDDVILEHETVADDEDQYDDDDDSNAEDNWRNDYPDEDGYYSSDVDEYDDYGEKVVRGGSSEDEFDHGYNMYRTGPGRREFDPFADDEGATAEHYFNTVASDNDDEI